MRIAILGNSGSGKSTLAGRLAARHEVATLDLDTVAWVRGEIAVPRQQEEAVEDVRRFCSSHADWVVEGCYAGLVAAALESQPHLLFLEPGLAQCQANCRNRPWEPHKYKSKEEQDERLAFLLDWVAEYYTRDGDLSLAAHQALFDGYPGPKEKLEALPEPRRLEAILEG